MLVMSGFEGVLKGDLLIGQTVTPSIKDIVMDTRPGLYKHTCLKRRVSEHCLSHVPALVHFCNCFTVWLSYKAAGGVRMALF